MKSIHLNSLYLLSSMASQVTRLNYPSFLPLGFHKRQGLYSTSTCHTSRTKGPHSTSRGIHIYIKFIPIMVGNGLPIWYMSALNRSPCRMCFPSVKKLQNFLYPSVFNNWEISLSIIRQINQLFIFETPCTFLIWWNFLKSTDKLKI